MCDFCVSKLKRKPWTVKLCGSELTCSAVADRLSARTGRRVCNEICACMNLWSGKEDGGSKAVGHHIEASCHGNEMYFTAPNPLSVLSDVLP